jgi:hypothetical protein
MRKYIMVYSIWNNKTDELVILDGTSKECAKAMGMSYSCFRSTLSKVSNGRIKKWTIEQRPKRISKGGEDDQIP